ncbi:MAG: DUF4276 family protein [Deltaproteobacteria bacterium]|nr:DUF4276 family protein [Deltaproteobacteria bacterium]
MSGLKKSQEKKKFRNPDSLENPSKELIKLTKKKYQKIAGSKAIAPHLNLQLGTNKSTSFNKLLSGIINTIKNNNIL